MNDTTRLEVRPDVAEFLDKAGGPMFGCVPENYSPAALLCRLGLPTSRAISVALAGKIAGKERNRPPMTGPQC